MKIKEIALPIGGRDWANGGSKCNRVKFFLQHEQRLQNLGYRPCLGFRGNDLLTHCWAHEAAHFAANHGWGIYWHPNFDAMYTIGHRERLGPALTYFGDVANYFHDVYKLQYLLVHPSAMNFGGYDPKDKNRYHSAHGAEDWADFFYQHVRPLQKLNEMTGGILAIENVHRVLFGQLSASRMYTYEGEQLGGQETPKLAQLVGCSTGIDSEHFFGMDEPRQSSQFEGPWTEGEEEWLEISGYYIHKGFKPVKIRSKTFEQFLAEMQPVILHLGGATRLMTKGLATSHMDFDLRKKSQRQILDCQIKYVEKNGGILETEVQGDDGIGWSPRPKNDWRYKRHSVLKIIGAIERLQSA